MFFNSSVSYLYAFNIINKLNKGIHNMNISKYISINSGLFVIGLYSNITLVISLYSIYHAINIIKNSYKCGVWLNTNIVLIVAMFLMLDFFDLMRFVICD